MSANNDGRTAGPKRTIVEEGTEFRGALSSTCPIVVMGQVDGEVKGPSIEVTESGRFSGKAKVETLRSRGDISGELDADVVELSGRVRDGTKIRARAIEVSVTAEPGGGTLSLTFGACALEIGDEPRKDEAIAAALSGARGDAPDARGDEAKAAPEADLEPKEASPKRGKRAAAPPEDAAPPATSPEGS